MYTCLRFSRPFKSATYLGIVKPIFCSTFLQRCCTVPMYGVFLKKVLHKREEKMKEKMKMTKQKDNNLVQVQQPCSVYFSIKIVFKS